MKIGIDRSFWKAALRIAASFRPGLRLPQIRTPASTDQDVAALSNPSASCGRSARRATDPNRRMFVASLIDPLIAFVSAHVWLAYLTLFLAALLEAVPVIGSVIPGSTIIFALSALVPGGDLRLEWVLAAA